MQLETCLFIIIATGGGGGGDVMMEEHHLLVSIAERMDIDANARYQHHEYEM